MNHPRLFRLLLFSVPLLLLSPRPSAANDRLDRYLSMRRLVGQEKFHDAIHQCKELISKHPDWLLLYESLSEISGYAQTLDEAQIYFQRRVETGDEIALAHFGLGEVFYWKGEYEKSFQSLLRAIDLGLSATECYRRLEYSLTRWLGVDESVRYFTSLCHRFPQNANFWYATALALFARNQWSRAKYYIDQAETIDPFQPEFAELSASIDLKACKTPALSMRYARLSELALQRGDFQSYFFLEASKAYTIGDGIGDNRLSNEIADLGKKAGLFGFLRWQAWSLNKTGDHLAYTCRYDSAFGIYALAGKTASMARDGDEQGQALTAQTDILLDQGRYCSAIDSSLQLLNLAKTCGSSEFWVGGLSKIGRALHEMGLDNLALLYAAEAADTLELSSSEANIAISTYDALGQIYLGLGNPDMSIKYFRLALKASGKFGNWVQAVINGNLGIALWRAGRPNDALVHLEAQLKGAVSSEYQREKCYAYAYLGDYYQMKSHSGQARTMYDSADAIAARTGLLPVRILCARGRSMLALIEGDEGEALHWARLAFDYVDRSLNIDEARGIGLLEGTSFRKDFETTVTLLTRIGDVSGAFEYLNRYKTHVANSKLPDGVLGLVRTPVQFSWESGQRVLRRYRSVPPGSLPVDMSLRRTDPAQGNEVPAPPDPTHTLERIQADILRPDEAILSFAVTGDQTTVFVLRTDTLVCARLPIGRSALHDKVGQVSKLFSSDGYSGQILNAEMADFSRLHAARLYNTLVLPIEHLLSGISGLVIVPDDALYSVPFELLSPDSAGSAALVDTTHQLIRRFSICYAFAPGCLRRAYAKDGPIGVTLLSMGLGFKQTHRPFESLASALSFRNQPGGRAAGEIPGAEEEARCIAELVKGKTCLLRGKEATAARFLEMAPRYSVIHLAAHANWHPKNPWISAIELAPDQGSDIPGELTLVEIERLRIDARLVVLSSCNTAWINGGEMGFGFPGAFYRAGARSVVASLWNVDDLTTATLMKGFYNYLKDGKPKSVALRQAKIDLINSGKSDPFYWAPFVLLGDPDAIDFTESKGLSYLIPTVLLVISILAMVNGLLIKWRRRDILS